MTKLNKTSSTICPKVYHNDKAFRRREAERQMWVRTEDGSGRRRMDAVKKEISQADAVSFDVFDTLLMRKTLYPEDVFELTALSCGLDPEEFQRRRKEAEHAFRHGTVYDIYSVLQKAYRVRSPVLFHISVRRS